MNRAVIGNQRQNNFPMNLLFLGNKINIVGSKRSILFLTVNFKKMEEDPDKVEMMNFLQGIAELQSPSVGYDLKYLDDLFELLSILPSDLSEISEEEYKKLIKMAQNEINQ